MLVPWCWPLTAALAAGTVSDAQPMASASATSGPFDYLVHPAQDVLITEFTVEVAPRIEVAVATTATLGGSTSLTWGDQGAGVFAWDPALQTQFTVEPTWNLAVDLTITTDEGATVVLQTTLRTASVGAPLTSALSDGLLQPDDGTVQLMLEDTHTFSGLSLQPLAPTPTFSVDQSAPLSGTVQIASVLRGTSAGVGVDGTRVLPDAFEVTTPVPEVTVDLDWAGTATLAMSVTFDADTDLTLTLGSISFPFPLSVGSVTYPLLMDSLDLQTTLSSTHPLPMAGFPDQPFNLTADTQVGQRAVLAVPLHNDGDLPLEAQVQVSTGLWTMDGGDLTIPPQSEDAVDLWFEPTTAGTHAATLAVQSNDPWMPAWTGEVAAEAVPATPDDTTGADDPQACGCASGPSAPALWLPVGLWALRRRRVQSA